MQKSFSSSQAFLTASVSCYDILVTVQSEDQKCTVKLKYACIFMIGLYS